MKRITRAIVIGAVSLGIAAGAAVPAQAWSEAPPNPGPCQAMWWKNCEFL